MNRPQFELLRAVLQEAVDQIKHLEELRRLDRGPTPATLTEDIVNRAEGLLALTKEPE